jgi:hypothetical protein
VGAAYRDGAEFWYRVNDDTKFVTPHWIRDFTAALQNFDPPGLGVVGPTFKTGHLQILTYDFVHRTHWEIFGFQYPPAFQNWWSDDWITKVYGFTRLSKLSQQHVTHAQTAGQRYTIAIKDTKKLQLHILPDELRTGACAIDDYLANNSAYRDKPTTKNAGGGCPRSNACDPPDGKATGADLERTWELVRDGEHPKTHAWSGCPLADSGLRVSQFTGCVLGRTDPDPVISCGGLCLRTAGCNAFNSVASSASKHFGRCCLKSSFDKEGTYYKTNGGKFFEMVRYIDADGV